MFTKKTKSVVRTIGPSAAAVNVHLRHDIGCGLIGCDSCATAAAGSGYTPTLLPSMSIMIPDTNVLLHNLNALEDSRLNNIVFLSSVLAETMNRNKAVYARVQRLIADPEKRCFVFANDRHEQTYCPARSAAASATESRPMPNLVAELPSAAASPTTSIPPSPPPAAASETPNDYNDRCIRVAALWLGRHYHKHLPALPAASLQQADATVPSPPSPPIIVAFVTHDSQLRSSIQDELTAQAGVAAPNFRCMTLRAYVTEVIGRESDLIEKLQHEIPEGMKESATARPGGGLMYRPHLSLTPMEAGIAENKFLKGKLRVSESSCFFGEIRGRWGSDADGYYDRVLIGGRTNMNRAIHDDVVCVQLLPMDEWRTPTRGSSASSTQVAGVTSLKEALQAGLTPCGTVVGILELRRRTYCGSIDVQDLEKVNGLAGPTSVLFQPKSGRIPKIRIHTSQVNDLKDKRLEVVIDDWPEHAAYPSGHYIDVLGTIGDRDTEAVVILKEHDIPHYDFSPAVYDCLPKGEWRVTDEEVAKRNDLRDLCVVSVDPLGCRDIDDALHCRVINGNHLEVGVHIADVTHFLHERTPMDIEAAKRSTSVYLVDRRINMLPQLLTENLCSLVGGEERYAFSIVWEFDEEFRVVRDWFGKTIIRSRAALYYGDAQKMIDDPNDNSEIALSLKRLMKLSKHFKSQREKDGALFLASQEFKFKVDNDHVNPTDMTAYQSFEANSMIEEWMLYANAAAARKIFEAFPRWTLLRRHQKPANGAFDSLNEALRKKCGVQLDDSSSLRLNRSLDQCVDPSDPFFNQLVRMLTTRCLKQAQYFSSGDVPFDEFMHFGLAMPIYTHFTSPIRRYADVIVHRQLAAAIAITNVSEDHMNGEMMKALSDTINYRHEQAQKAGRDSQNLFTGFFLRNYGNGAIPDEDGYVVKVSDSHVSVLVPKYGQEGRIAKEALLREPALLEKVRVRIRIMQQGDVLHTKLVYTIVGNDASGEGDTVTQASRPRETVATADIDGEPPIKRSRPE